MSTEPTSPRVTGWDRTVIIALGGAGCALSYDALQQMATAIHVRGPLSYVFPLVIDGFIAYGVRALLVLKDAPLRARLYVWTLFGTATAASIWANALHAVRLNQQAPVDGLRLGDTVVAVLSTIAPLALAGAVHLYILIARYPDRRRRRGTGTPVTARSATTLQSKVVDTPRVAPTGGPDNRSVAGHALSPTPAWPDSDRETGQGNVSGHFRAPVTGPEGRSVRGAGQDKGAVTGSTRKRRPFQPDAVQQSGQDTLTGLGAMKAPVRGHRATITSDRADPVSAGHQAGKAATPPGYAKAAAQDTALLDRETEKLLEIARRAVRAEDKLTRKVVAEAIRGQRIPLSNDTLTALMIHLRRQHGQPVGARRD